MFSEKSIPFFPSKCLPKCEDVEKVANADAPPFGRGPSPEKHGGNRAAISSKQCCTQRTQRSRKHVERRIGISVTPLARHAIPSPTLRRSKYPDRNLPHLDARCLPNLLHNSIPRSDNCPPTKSLKRDDSPHITLHGCQSNNSKEFA